MAHGIKDSTSSCKVEGCPDKALSRELCGMHYARWRRTGDPGSAQRRYKVAPPECSADDCTETPESRGLCTMHYARWRRTGDTVLAKKLKPVCRVENCPEQHKAHGLCQFHLARQKKYGDPVAGGPKRRYGTQGCGVPGCPKPHEAHGWCHRHDRLWRLYGDPAKQVYASPGQASHYSDGYRHIHVNGRIVKEHRHVMEQHLGRPLASWENVHHRDGNRARNDIANLELWVTKQPKGQRATDLLAWAEEIVARYGPERDLL